MKEGQKAYIKRLVRGQLPYFLIFVILTVSAFIIVPFMLSNLNKSTDDVKKLKKEVDALSEKKKSFENAIFEVSDSLDDDIHMMSSLIPDLEDYFTIIYGLDQLAQKSGFIITDYAVSVKESTANKLSLSVSGIGDAETFIKFLKEYNFGGGRLITVENISADAKNLGGNYKLSLNFYNKKAGTEFEGNKSYVVSQDDLNKIRSKVSFVLTNEDVLREIDNDYPKKDNPF